MQAPMQEAPAQEGAEVPAEGGDAAQVIMDVSKSIAGVAKALEQVNPDAAKAMDELNKQFQAIINSVGGGEQQAPQGQGMASPEAAGAPGAKPAGMMR